jgi:hypothetical protein
MIGMKSRPDQWALVATTLLGANLSTQGALARKLSPGIGKLDLSLSEVPVDRAESRPPLVDVGLTGWGRAAN